MGYRVKTMGPDHRDFEAYKGVRGRINKSICDFLRRVRILRDERIRKEKAKKLQQEQENASGAPQGTGAQSYGGMGSKNRLMIHF